MFSDNKHQKYMNVKSIGYEKMQFEIEQNATSWYIFISLLCNCFMVDDRG